MKPLAPLLVLAACSSSPAPQPSEPAPATPAPSEPTAADTACTSNDDCVIVETACCDHCNGGSAVAFNRASADAHKPAPGTCENTACTLMGCGPMTASCEAGTCKATQNPL